MGIDFARLPPREGKATPGFLWREAKQRASSRRLPPVVHTHSHASSAPSQARLFYPGDSGIPGGLPDMPPILGGVSHRDTMPEHHGDRGSSLQSLRGRGMALTGGGSSADVPPYPDLIHHASS